MTELLLRKKSIKTAALGVLIFLIGVTSASAFEPLYKLSGYGQTDFYQGSEDVYILLGGGIEAGQRLLFNSGYWSWFGTVMIDRYIAGAGYTEETEDNEQLAADVHIDGDRLGFEFGVTLNTALNTIDYGSVLEPEWSASLLCSDLGSNPGNEGNGSFYGSLDYNGSSVSREQGNEDRFFNGVGFTFGYDHSLKLGLFLSAGAGILNYREYYLLDASGAQTDSLRRDHRFEAELGAEGLAGFFADWKTGVYTQLHDSNANRWIENGSTLEEDSEDRLVAGLQTEFNWSPRREVELGFSGYTDYGMYFHREALDAAGVGTGEELRVLKLGGKLDGSWTADGKSFLNIGLSFYRSFSEDPDFDTWSLGIEAGFDFLP